MQHRDLRNFDEGPAFSSLPAEITRLNPVRIQEDDLLAISVQTVDPSVSAPFNFGGIPMAVEARTGASATNTQTAQSGGGQTYLVDANGEINFPLLGKIRLQGLSTLQARDTVTARLRRFLTEPIVNVRLLNFKFTVLGEVNSSGTFTIPGERVNLLEALGMAGDLTSYGNRENVLVVREVDGKRTYGYVNLHQRDVFQSPFFYLAQNDLVYVEPLRAKVGGTTDQATKIIQWTLPIISIITLVVSLWR